jgi:class 3 adenylate cyclase
MPCPACGHSNRPEAAFCGNCGTSLKQEILCPQCGASNQPGQKFCDACGQMLAQKAPAAPQEKRAAPAAPAAPMPESLAGGRYVVKRFLGEGAKKRVYLAHDASLDRDVAVALIKTEGLDESGIARVRREAQAMGRLGSHPHIVTVHDIGDERGQPFIVQELMEGGSLSELVRTAEGERLEVDTALRLAQEIAGALGYAHQRKVVHRDVKPGNVWLTKDRRAKLGDFGLAMAVDRTRLTQAGMMVGTVAYMPPEQALGGDITARSDLYSLGALLYEMLTGRPPFPGDDTVSVISQHLNTPPLPPSILNPDIPGPLDKLVLRLLAKSPDDRPQGADDVQAELSRIATTAPASVHVEATVPETVRRAGARLRSPFVARDKELAQLKERFDDAIGAQGFLMMAVGEPGIGKTRLTEELAVYARLRGAQVLVGHCYETEGAPPYTPFIEVLRQYVDARPADALREEMGDAASNLAKLVSEIRARVPDLPPSPPREPEAERYQLLEAVCSFLLNAARANPLLVVLDDIHWADRPTLLMLQHLARRLSSSRLLVVGTYRDVELDRRHPLSEMLAQLRRERLYERVLLRGLQPDGVYAFLTARAQQTGGAHQEVPHLFAEQIHQQTEGNPFFIEETVTHLADIGAIYLENGRWVGNPEVLAENIPEGVREVIGRRLSRLSDDTNELLTLASVLGRDFDFDVLQKLAEKDEAAMLSPLEEALGAQLITEHRGSSGAAYRFSHALVQETLYDELSLVRRQRVHLRAGQALEQVRAGRLEPLVGQLANHFYQGNDAERAIRYSCAAGDAALRVYGWEEAVRHWKKAVELLEDRSDAKQERARLLERLGDVTYMSGVDFEAGVSFLEQALAIHERLGARERAAMIHSRLGRNMVSFGGRLDLKRGATHLEAAREILEEDAPGSPALAYAYVGMCTRFFWTLECREALEYTRRALDIGERLQSRPIIASALAFDGIFRAMTGELRHGAELLERSLKMAEEEGLTFVIFLATVFRVQIDLHLRRDPKASLRRLQAELERDRLGASSHMTTFVNAWVGLAHIFSGQMDKAREIRERVPELVFSPLETDLRFAGGDWKSALKRSAGALEEGKKVGNQATLLGTTIMSSTVHFLSDDDERAEELLRVGTETAASSGVVLHGGGVLNALFARLLARTGRVDEAREVVNRCREVLAGGEDWGGSVTFTALADAVVLTAEGNIEAAEKAFDEALDVARKYTLVWEEADALRERGRLHVKRGKKGDRTRALELFDEAVAIYRRLGAKKHLELVVADKVRAQGLDSVDFQTSVDVVAADVQREKPDLRQHAAPDGTVTLMFSDMEGFTSMTERLGDLKAREVIRDHNRIVREQLSAHGGYEVELQGDGFLLAFGSARRALQCAIAVQKSFATYNETHGEQPVRVRIGLHTGEALRDADKFFGKTVILAARIAAKAKGEEILVSSVLKQLTETAGDLHFGSDRLVDLKGISEPQRIYEVRWNGARG